VVAFDVVDARDDMIAGWLKSTDTRRKPRAQYLHTSSAVCFIVVTPTGGVLIFSVVVRTPIFSRGQRLPMM
jgi:hypothetical protein